MENTHLLTGLKIESWSDEMVNSLSAKVDDNYDKYIIFRTLYNNLIDTKNKIATIQNQWDRNKDFTLVSTKKYESIEDWSDWNSVKKISNPYELIYIPSRSINNSIAYYIPVSRSYFKMVEILNEFNLFGNWDQNITITCLAEGPGGFIEAITKHRKDYSDNIFGITLRSNNRNVPNWKRLQYALAKLEDCKPIVDLSYGDLYKEDDIRRFVGKVRSTSAVITADGGFDYTTSFNYQEQVSYRLIFAEILTALHLQARGGHFVCKIFDIFSIFTMKIIYLLYCFYDRVYLYKPKTSRPANSEKYIVAMGFKGISPIWLYKLREIQENWIQADNSTLDIEGLNLPNNFVTSIFKFNQKFVTSQISNINLTLSMINKPLVRNKYQKILQEQIKHAVEWCKKYGEGVNYKSKYRIYY